MPTSFDKSHKARKYKKYKKSNPRKALTPYPFPRTQVSKLRYVEEIYIDASGPTVATNGIAFNTFRANGCHDPNMTGVGHQPRGWDEHKTLYNQYVVLGSKITIQPTRLDSTDKIGYFGIIRRTGTSSVLSSLTNIGDIMETRNGVYRRMSGFRSGGPERSLTMKFSHKKQFSTSPLEHTHLVSGDPTLQNLAVWDCYVIPNSQESGDPPAIPFLVTIEYIVMFKEPNHLAQS